MGFDRENDYLRSIDEDYLKAEQAAALARDKGFVLRVATDIGIYESISGTGKVVEGLSAQQQVDLGNEAHDVIIMYMGGHATADELLAALDKCKPAFKAVIDCAADDEVNA
jgi:hypothetical protein